MAVDNGIGGHDHRVHNFGHFFVSAFISVAPTPSTNLCSSSYSLDSYDRQVRFRAYHCSQTKRRLAFSGCTSNEVVSTPHSNRCEIAHKLVRFGFYYSIFTEVTDVDLYRC